MVSVTNLAEAKTKCNKYQLKVRIDQKDETKLVVKRFSFFDAKYDSRIWL